VAASKSDEEVGNFAQADKFAELARSLECDEDEARWEEKLKKLAKPAKPGSKGRD